MAVRYRNATPGTLMCLIATALLAVVSFNVPLLKSLKFLHASYSSGDYSGTLDLGTLGYCRTLASGGETCVGPQVGYEFDPNSVFGVTLFDIPEAITKYLTYVLILHVVALGFAALATLFGLIAHSPTFTSCFAIWMASIASTITLLALIFDLAMFYIARARINSVSGASAEIGIAVWLTLAAWIILALSGCFFGIGNCCGSCRSNDDGGDPKRSRNDRRDGGEDDYKMRMMAIDNERQRKQNQEQGLPSFQELTPLKDDGEDKYLIDHHNQQPQQQQPGGLRRDGSVLQGVGMGYGRRNNRTPANDPYATGSGVVGANGYPGGWGQQAPPARYQNLAAPPPAALARRGSDATTAGEFAGVGAGPGGIVTAQPQGYGNGAQQGYYGEHQYGNGPDAGSDQGHGGQYGDQYQNPNDTYNQHSYNDPYSQPQQEAQYADPYRSSSVQPQGYGASYAAPIAMPTPGVPPQTARSPNPQYDQHQQQNYDTSFDSSDSHYHDPGPRVSHADPYDGYDDGGLGAIGMAAASGSGRHERDYTGQTFGVNDSYNSNGGGGGVGGYSDSQMQYGGGGGAIQQPAPQHLVHPTATSDLLRSPVSPAAGISGGGFGNGYGGGGGGYGGGGGGAGGYGLSVDQQEQPGAPRPPSYTAGNYAVPSGGNGGEKSSYRH
ncbi:hypothetical protein IAU59_007059 [Kwoniella sp. CBS 9459]